MSDTLRQPKGTPTGGQFAGKTNPESDVSLDPGVTSNPDAPPDSLLQPLAYGDQEELDDLIPQANSPEKIFATVDAVEGGCVSPDEIGSAIGMSGRQGMYYAEAARALGLMDRYGSPWTYALTERGAEAFRMSDQDRAKAMSQVMAENIHVDTMLMDGEQALIDSWDGDLSDKTTRRRVSTIKSWSDYFMADHQSQVNRMRTARTGTTQRAVSIVTSRRPKSAPVKRCPRCNLVLPSGSNLCDICD